MEQITKERIKEILNGFKQNPDLFNWCKEYNQFIDEQVILNVTSEVDYIIKKSYEDEEAPLSYQDLDGAKMESLKHSDIVNRMVENTQGLVIKNTDLDYIESDETLNSLYRDAEEELFNEIEIYSWYVVGDRLRYWLEQEDEIILDGQYWGRQARGQRVALDYPVIHAFIKMLESWISD